MTKAPGPRRTAAALLVAEAIAVTTPMLALAGYVAGSQMIGTSLAHVRVGDVVAQGIVQALTPLTGILLLLAAWGVWHAARGVGALLLQPAVLGFAGIPFLRPMTSVDVLPAGIAIAVGLVIVTTVLLVVILTKGRPAGLDTRHRRWWWLGAYAAGVMILAVLGAGQRTLPGNPTMWWADPGSGTVPAVRAAEPVAPQNPGLAANPWNSIHNDSWASDAYADVAGPADPLNAAVDSLFTGGDCATITFDSRGRLITLCSSLTTVTAFVVDPTDLSVIHQEQVGSRTPDLTDFSGGGYFVLDDEDRIVFPAAGGVLTVLATADGIEPVTQIPVADTLIEGEKVTSVLPDWRGRYWYVGSKGTVGVVAETGGAARAVNLGAETIENSFAVTRDGVFVVTGAASYRLWTKGDDAPPTVVWRTTYDAGERHKPGQTSGASGTTPTVFADGRLVAYTDNADPQMHVVVARADTGEVTCDFPVFAEFESASENSIIAAGNTLIVENNYGYRPAITSASGGHSTVPGLTAIDVDPDSGSCQERWTNSQITIPSLVSKATLAGNLVLTYTKPPNPWGLDAWYFTAVDLDTGQVAWQRLAGTGIAFNNHYAAGYLSPAGDMVVGTVNGLVVLRNTAAG